MTIEERNEIWNEAIKAAALAARNKAGSDILVKQAIREIMKLIVGTTKERM